MHTLALASIIFLSSGGAPGHSLQGPPHRRSFFIFFIPSAHRNAWSLMTSHTIQNTGLTRGKIWKHPGEFKCLKRKVCYSLINEQQYLPVCSSQGHTYPLSHEFFSGGDQDSLGAADFISMLKQEKIRVASEHAMVPERGSSPERWERSRQDRGSS